MHELKELYQKNIVPEFVKHGKKNRMAVPRLTKIVINCGMGEALADKKVLEKMAAQLAVIAGQKPQIMRAKRAISSFKLRAGDAVGLRATLRGTRMYDFFAKFIRIALPRVRDFHGMPTRGFDGRGNYTMGVTDQSIFPELEYSLIDKPRGFEITFVTSAGNDADGKKLLTLFGIPFVK
ncbi:MAG: 50S ribosomal protein L5 [Candidatus Gottesmanbacteria bacterium GW2011_GWB1_49_7]|uniref:Large ribosomal subunit protein uL5 n=1 Tax=Candidatus Gottesmanbacteria bacterium GW2011_GWB1_49_7 TaxID=1618448 RepID=A0A0G1YYH6_9BACT|nr:MAG: ribosomal protein L5, large subunit ribosomal protein L5 [Microgenomates group bacterium GW2011_GWC1_49_7]KKW11424.1 MAG: 50S ribosomal protein L5 [Candidatus Gottesmanbacteria bacterium GW2011_GWB1_49_7]